MDEDKETFLLDTIGLFRIYIHRVSQSMHMYTNLGAFKTKA